MMDSLAKNLLNEGLQQTGLSGIGEPLVLYLELLQKWNKAYNLTAVREAEMMVSRHIFDSLAVLPWVQGSRIVDVGTGAGLPGIPLALAKPDCQWVLLDSNGKKIRFLQEVKRVLAISNLEIIQSRVENYRPGPAFDTVVSRAFSELQQMVFWSRHLLKPEGIFLAMKGRIPESELQLISNPYQVEPYKAFGQEAERCCIIIRNN